MTAHQGRATFAVNTYSYTQTTDVAECLSRLDGLGFTAVELMAYPGHLWPASLSSRQREGIAGFMAQRDMSAVTLNMPNVDVNIAGASQEMRSYSIALLRQFLQLAADLGARAMIVGPGKANPLFPAPREQLTGYLFSALDELTPLSQETGCELWLENMPFAFLPGADELLDAVETYGDDHIGICYDVANAWFIGEDLRHGLARAGRRLRLVHLSDTGTDVYRHDPVGHGTVPFETIPGLLAEHGYDGPPVLEVISRDPDTDIPASVDGLMRRGWPAALGKA